MSRSEVLYLRINAEVRAEVARIAQETGLTIASVGEHLLIRGLGFDPRSDPRKTLDQAIAGAPPVDPRR